MIQDIYLNIKLKLEEECRFKRIPTRFFQGLRFLCRFCGGSTCKDEDYKKNPIQNAFPGLHSNWVTTDILAMQRPSSRIIKEYDLISKFKVYWLGIWNWGYFLFTRTWRASILWWWNSWKQWSKLSSYWISIRRNRFFWAIFAVFEQIPFRHMNFPLGNCVGCIFAQIRYCLWIGPASTDNVSNDHLLIFFPQAPEGVSAKRRYGSVLKSMRVYVMILFGFFECLKIRLNHWLLWTSEGYSAFFQYFIVLPLPLQQWFLPLTPNRHPNHTYGQ